MKAIAYAKGGREVAYFATTYEQARNIAWSALKETTRHIWAKAPNESRLELRIKSQDGGESRITLRGFENVETARGQQFDFLVIDEVAQMRNWNYNWQAVLEPTLAFRKGSALFISTPLGYNHFWEMFKRGQGENPFWKSWKFTSYDNPYLSVDRLNQARADMDEDYFAQEYLGEFKKYTGLIYKDFSREIHVVKPIELLPHWTYYRGLDFGWVHPTAAVFVAITDKGIMYVFDEIYMTGLKTPDLAAIIKQKSGERMFTQTVADSAQASDIAELQMYGLGVIPVSKTTGSDEADWTSFRVRKVSEKLKHGKLFIFENCTNLIFEFENYRQHEVNSNGTVREVPMKANDHALDALSYMVVTLPEIIVPVFNNQSYRSNNFDNWKI